MNEEKIVQELSEACQDNNIQFQIILQESKLYIYINRKPNHQLDYQQLTETISFKF